MKLWRTIANHLVPWRGNTHRPHILRRGWLVAFLAIALLSEGVILSQAVLAPGPNVFLAAVLRSDVIAYTGDARAGEGGQPLVESDVLDAAAQAKAEDMASKGYFAHVGPEGEEPWVWLQRQGYEYAYAGENLAVRFNDSKDVVDAWMASPAHRANILKPVYQEIGVGLAEGTYKGGPATFVVQYFGTPAKAAVPAEPDAPAADTDAAVVQAPGAPEEPSVAGAQTQAALAQAAPAPQQSFMQSASRAIIKGLSDAPRGASWALAGVAMLLIVVLALTFFVRIQVQPTDLLLPGLAVALVAVACIAANAKFLPSATQTASVAGFGAGDIAGGDSASRISAFPEAPAR